MSKNASTSSTSTTTYEEIMGIGRGGSGANSTSSAGGNVDTTNGAIQALSNRLSTFRKWLTDDAKVIVHPAICIVNGEATDGTKNAPVMVVHKPMIGSGGMASGHNNNVNTNINGGGAASSGSSANTSGPGAISMLGNRTDKPSVIDNTAFNGRIGTVDGEGEVCLYDRTMGCCVRAVRELKPNEVIITMPRSAMITPDVVAASDAGRAILACCKINKNAIEITSSTSTGSTDAGATTVATNTTATPGFWDAFENTTICESKFSPKITRTTGPQVLVKILQERKKAEQAYKKSLAVNEGHRDRNNTSNIPETTRNDDEDEKHYRLAEYGTISTRAPVLAFLIHQRFYNTVRPLVVSKSDLSLYDDDDDDEHDEENEFQIARDSDDGNALSSIDTHGGTMTEVPYGSPDTFGPYARTLPSSVSMPLCWKRSELALFANCIPGVPLLQEVATMTSQLVSEFIAILEAGITTRFPKTFPEGLLTWDRWVWAAAVFSSRNLPASCYFNAGEEKAQNFRPSHKMEFQSPTHIWDELGVMIPLLDMLNHEIDEHQVTWQPCVPSKDLGIRSSNNGAVGNDNTESIEAHPPRAIVHKKVKKGSELYCCYGQLSTSNLILQYGFAQINGVFDEVRMGWALQDAVGKVDAPTDYIPTFAIEKNLVFESNDEKSISAWWTDDRIKLLEQEAFASADTSFMPNLRAGKKMTVSAMSDGTFHPILLTATVVATMPESHVRKFIEVNADNSSQGKVIISKAHQRIIQRYLQFTFTRKLEKLLQNLDNGLKDHFGKINLWTKSSSGGIRYDGNGEYVGWQTFFDAHAYKATMEVEKKYYAMGSDSCVLALYDGQLRALQLSVDNISDDAKFVTGVMQQLKDLGFEVSEEEIEIDEDEVDCNNLTNDMDTGVITEAVLPVEIDKVPEDKQEGNTDAVASAPIEVKAAENGKVTNGSKSPRSRRRNRKKGSSNNANNSNSTNTAAAAATATNIVNNSNLGGKPPAVKLHIGNLSYATTPSNLYDYFSSIYGQDNVLECHIPIERDSGKSRGFGFVAMPEAIAKRALHSRQKHEVDGRVLKIAKSNSAGTVSTSKPPEAPPPPTTGRCPTCGYRPKYCTCTAPNLAAGFNRFPMGPRGPMPPPPQMPPQMPPPMPPPHLLGPMVPIGPPVDYGRDLPRDYGYYRGGPVDRHLDGHMRPRDRYDGDDRYRDRDRRAYEYRYDEEYYRGGGHDRDGDHYKDGARRDRGRDRSRSRSRSLSRSHSSSRRRDNDDVRGSREKDESRGFRRVKKEEIDDVEQGRKRNLERKDRNKKKKSKRRGRSRSRSRSRSASPP